MKFIWLFLLFTGCLSAQTSLWEITPLKYRYENFEYRHVIRLADSLLFQEASFDTTARIELLTMKGVAHYTLKETNQANDTFLNILKLDPDHEMDLHKTSPKIVEFYNVIKKSYKTSQTEQEAEKPDTEQVPLQQSQRNVFRSALTRSVLVPGWGHYSYDKKTRGRFLVATTLLTLPPAIYYAIDTAGKEKDYLNETDRNRIESRYQKYNTSFKLRNTFIVAYLALWIYSQADIMSVTSEMQPSFSFTMEPFYANRTCTTLTFTWYF